MPEDILLVSILQWSDKLQKLDFQEMVMFLQHLPTHNWTHQELEMVLSRAYMWHSMFNSSPSHLASWRWTINNILNSVPFSSFDNFFPFFLIFICPSTWFVTFERTFSLILVQKRPSNVLFSVVKSVACNICIVRHSFVYLPDKG